jgi:hypothetical protein
MRRFAAAVLSAVLAAPAAPATAEEAPFQVTVVQEGVPDANVEITFALATQGKVNVGTTDTQGQLSFALDAVNVGKRVRIEVVVDDCPAEGRDAVYLVAPDGQLPAKQPDCERRDAGFLLWGDARRIVVDVRLGTLTAKNGGISKVVLFGVPVAALVGGAAVIGGGSNTPATTSTPTGTTTVTPGTGQPTTGTPSTSTPAGQYNVIRLVILLDVDGHHQFVNLTVRVIQIAGSGTALMLTGDGNWQPIQVAVGADGTFAGEGRGTFAGRQNVPFRVTGTLNQTTRRIVLRITIGGGTLPGNGNDITYELELQG